MKDATPPPGAATPSQLEEWIDALERHMQQMQLLHGEMFALANAWATRHDAILAATPAAMQGEVQTRLNRIGIRWGMSPGCRVTTEFKALPPLPTPADDD